MKGKLNKFIKKKIIFIRSLILLLTIFVFGISATVVHSNTQFNIKIKYLDNIFEPKDNMANKLFFNANEESEISFEADFSSYYEKNSEDILEEGEIADPFVVFAKLNENINIDNINIEKILSDEGIFEGKYNVKVNIPAGNNEDKVNITIQVIENTWDINTDFSTNFTIIRDLIKPEINITGISDNSSVADSVFIELNENYKDTAKMNINISVDGTELNVNGEYNGTEKVKITPTIDGEYTGKVTAIDKAGNIAVEKEISFYMNRNLPTITFNDEVIKSYYNNGKIVIHSYDISRINFDESRYVLKNVDNLEEPIIVVEGIFTELNRRNAEAILDIQSDGRYELEVSVVDMRGSRKDTKDIFVLDTVAPKVSISGVIDGEVYNEGKLVKFTIEDKNLKSIILNGVNIEKSSLKQDEKNKDLYTYIYEVNEIEGENIEHKFEIIAEDNAGSISKANIGFVIDNKKPIIEFNGVDNDSYYNTEKEVVIKVHDEYLLDENILIEAIKYTNDSDEEGTTIDIGKFTNGILKTKFNENGKYKITIEAKDNNRNAETKSVFFVVDNKKPVVILNSDGINEYNITPKDVVISVEEDWFKSNEVNVQVTEEIDEFEKDSKKNVLPSKWISNKVKTEQIYSFNQDGKYTIGVTAKDKANKEVKVDPISFIIDKTYPKINISGVENNQYYNTDREVIITNTDTNHDINKVVVIKDGKNYSIGNFSKDGRDRVVERTFTEEGNYEINVTSIDKAGLETTKKIAFTIDKKTPVVQIKDKNNNEDIVSGKHYSEFKEIVVSIEDVNFENYSIKVNNEEKEFEKVADSNILKYELNANIDQVYSIYIQAEDKAENKEVEISSFVIDTTKPVINIENFDVINGSFNKSVESVKVNIDELNFDKDKLKVNVTKKEPNKAPQLTVIEGKDINILKLDEENGKYEFTLDNIFEDDAIYEISVDINDIAGNEIDPVSKNKVSFTVDNTDASIKISGPLDKKYYKDNEISLEVRVDDNNHNINKVMIEKVSKEIGKASKIENQEYTNPITEGSEQVFNISLKEEATYNVTVYSKDKAGNITEISDKYSFVIDRTEPVIDTNFTNINGSYSNAQKTAIIKITEVNWKEQYTGKPLIAIVKGEKITADMNVENIDLSFELTGEVTEVNYENEFADDAIYNINVSINDISGNVAKSQSVNFITDKTSPSISIEGVENNEYYNMDRHLVITNYDLNHNTNKVTVTRNGSLYPVSDFISEGRSRVVKHTFTQEGEYEVVVTSTDKAGNNTTHPVVKFTIDKTAPVITPYNKSENRVLINGEYINKVFTPEFRLNNPEDKIESITLNGKGNLANSLLIASEEMVYTYKVVASDKAKNITNSEITFTLDTTLPEIKISGILSGFFSEDMRPTYEITDKNLDKSKTSATLNGEAFVSGTIINSQGHYNLKFVGTDLANNITTRNIGFTIDKDKPVIKFAEPISGEYFTNNFTPNFIIDDLTDYTIIAMTLDGEDYELGQEIIEEGKHVLYIEVKDRAENIESVSVEFILDKTPPKFIVDGVENNGKYFESVSAKIKLDNPNDTIKSIEVNGEIVQGDIKEENGQEVVNLDFNEIKSYELKLIAADEAGNLTEETINFEVIEKNVFVKLYQNKSMFYPTVILAVAVLISIGFVAFKKIK